MPSDYEHPLCQTEPQAAAGEAFPPSLPLQSPAKIATVYLICILRWFKRRTGGTAQYTRCGGVVQQYKAVAFIEHIAGVAGNEADQSSRGTRTEKSGKGNPEGKQTALLPPPTVCWYTYILNLTSCKDAPDSCYRYSQYVVTSYTHSSHSKLVWSPP